MTKPERSLDQCEGSKETWEAFCDICERKESLERSRCLSLGWKANLLRLAES